MDDAVKQRFQKVIGLLGSDHDGERSNAAKMATAMLRGAGMTWADVGMGSGHVNHINIDMKNISAYWEMMYRGERELSLRRAAEIQKLKRELAKAQTPPPLHAEPKLSRKQRRNRAAEEAVARETGELTEKDLRQDVREVLREYDAGELPLPERTEEFLRSVDRRQYEWTDKQREAVERTLKWVNAGRKGAAA